jgi:quercetin dioxygenase-like cupin family protein
MKFHSLPPMKPAIVSSTDGHRLDVLGDRVVVKLTGAETNGGFALCAITAAPGGGPPPHFHLHEDELFLVREGRLTVLVDGVWTTVETDGVIFAPRGSVHTYRNDTDRACRFWMLATPAGIESCFTRLAGECARQSPPDLKQVETVCAQHGIHFMPAGTGDPGP